MNTPKQQDGAALAPVAGSALTPAELSARAIIAGDLFREGRITRGECFRLEVDAACSRDSGPIRYEHNTEYSELVGDRSLCDDDRVSLAYERDELPPMDRPEDF